MPNKVPIVQFKFYLDATQYYLDNLPTGEHTRYYTMGRGWTTSPTGTPANTWITPRVLQPLALSQSLFGNARLFGRSQSSYGELIFANHDGALDYLQFMGLDGRELLYYEVDDQYPLGLFAAIPLFKGTMESVHFDMNTVTVKVKDYAFNARTPFQPTRFAGNNALPSGVEGSSGDLIGRAKPWIDGRVSNFAPPMVNTSRLIFQVSDYAINDILTVYAGGVSVGAKEPTNYATLADLYGVTAPGAAYGYRCYFGSEGSFFRLRLSSGQYEITCDAQNGATFTDRAAGVLFGHACDKLNLDWDTGAAAVVNAENNFPLGIVVDPEANGTELTCADVLDLIANSVGCYWWADTDGVLYLTQLKDPATQFSEATLDSVTIKAIERVRSADDDRGLPIWRAIVKYNKCWQLQTSGLSGLVSETQRAFLQNEYRRSVSSDSSIKTIHPLAPTLRRESLIFSQGGADTESARLLALHSVRRDMYYVDCQFETPAETWAARLGKVITVIYPRYDLSVGKQFLIIGRDLYSGSNYKVRLTLWG